MSKIYLLSFFLLTISINAQIINIPDVNFKNKLLTSNSSNGFARNNYGQGIVVDVNNDGEIEVAEALNIYELDLRSNFLNTTNDILDLDGIQSFTNLTILNCFGNSISALNLQGLNKLETINANDNKILNVNFTGLVAVNSIRISNNLLETINIDDLVNLELLYVFDNQLQALNFNNHPLLESVWCSRNKMTALDFSKTPALKYLVCSENNLTSVNFGAISSLVEFLCYNNNLTAIDILNLHDLTYFDFSENQISNINFPQISSLNYMSISGNPLTSIDLSSLKKLRNLYASAILVTSLDCSQTAVEQLFCEYNPNIQTINVKNNVYTYSDPDLLFFAFRIENNSNLISICVDEGEQNQLTYFDYNTSGTVVVYTGTDCTKVVIPEKLSTKNFEKNNFILFPNPTNSLLNISINSEIKTITIYNTLGQMIKNYANNQKSIDVSDLKKGTYFISVETIIGKVTQKFIKS